MISTCITQYDSVGLIKKENSTVLILNYIEHLAAWIDNTKCE